MTVISLVRHGLVENPTDIYYGRLPGFALAAAGREQAAATGRYLAQWPIAAIYHSPMQRALETASLIAARHPTSPPLIESPLLIEVHTPFDGTPVADMERLDWNLYGHGDTAYEFPPVIQARVVAFFDLARARHPGQHVVAVSHGDPIYFAILYALGRPTSVDQRPFLKAYGLSEGYPVPASVSTFTWADEADEQRPNFGYYVPTATS